MPLLLRQVYSPLFKGTIYNAERKRSRIDPLLVSALNSIRSQIWRLSRNLESIYLYRNPFTAETRSIKQGLPVKKTRLSAFLAVILIGGLILESVMCFGIVQASTGDSGIPKPSVPEFTLNLIGYGRIEVKIKNQPFTPYWTQENNYTGTINLFYNIRCKWPSAENWTYLCGGGLEGYAVRETLMQDYDSEYTVLSYETSHSPIDFQVEAVIGYEQSVLSPPPFPMTRWVIIGESSGWSDTQTVITGESQTPTPSPVTSPTPIPVPGQSFFFVESNSTVSELFFNSTSAELSFTVSGPVGTAGYVKVTIAKSLVSSVQSVKVYLDGKQLDVAITSDEDSWLLSFNYLHSTHHVRISLAADAGGATFLGIEYWTWIVIVIIIAVAGVVGFIVWRKKNKP